MHCVKSVHTRSFSSPYFPVFGMNTESISQYSVRMRENTDQKNSEYGHFSCHVINSISCEKLAKYLIELYSEPSQTSKIEFFVKTGNGFSLQKQPQEVFYEKGIFNNLTKFTGKHLHQSLFLK